MLTLSSLFEGKEFPLSLSTKPTRDCNFSRFLRETHLPLKVVRELLEHSGDKRHYITSLQLSRNTSFPLDNRVDYAIIFMQRFAIASEHDHCFKANDDDDHIRRLATEGTWLFLLLDREVLDHLQFRSALDKIYAAEGSVFATLKLFLDPLLYYNSRELLTSIIEYKYPSTPWTAFYQSYLDGLLKKNPEYLDDVLKMLEENSNFGKNLVFKFGSVERICETIHGAHNKYDSRHFIFSRTDLTLQDYEKIIPCIDEFEQGYWEKILVRDKMHFFDLETYIPYLKRMLKRYNKSELGSNEKLLAKFNVTLENFESLTHIPIRTLDIESRGAFVQMLSWGSLTFSEILAKWGSCPTIWRNLYLNEHFTEKELEEYLGRFPRNSPTFDELIKNQYRHDKIFIKYLDKLSDDQVRALANCQISDRLMAAVIKRGEFPRGHALISNENITLFPLARHCSFKFDDPVFLRQLLLGTTNKEFLSVQMEIEETHEKLYTVHKLFSESKDHELQRTLLEIVISYEELQWRRYLEQS